MRPLPIRTLAARYSVAAAFAVLVSAGEATTAMLGPRKAAALRLWASTNVANLHHHPAPAVVLSAFLSSGSQAAWLALIALAMFGANRAAGNLRLALICGAGHVLGTAVSEGIVAYRVDHGNLPASFVHLIDIGPSYVVVSAVVIAVAFGSWTARAAALAAFAALIFVGHIFAGLTSLGVAAVGHVTAMTVAAIFAVALHRSLPVPPRAAPPPGGTAASAQAKRAAPARPGDRSA
jgi:hypothetical protein